MIEKHECGWLVDMRLTGRQAERVKDAIARSVETMARLRGKGAYYRCWADCKIEFDPSGKAVTLLRMTGDVGYGRPERQIIHYRDNGDGTYYLEGDLQADATNQYAFEAGLKELCKIWGCDIREFGFAPVL